APLRRSGRRRGGRPRRRPSGRGGVVVTGVRELRPVRELRAARGGFSGAGAKDGLMARRRHPHPVEYNILLTATMCLLAAGAVMVFSASAARPLLSGQGPGTEYLIRYVASGAVGLGVMLL